MRWLLGAVAATSLWQGALANELDLRYLPAAAPVAAPTVPVRAIPAPRPVVVAPVASPNSVWSRFYIGGHMGAGWGGTTFSNPFGASLYGDRVATRSFAGGGQFGYDVQSEHLVLGVEAAFSAIDSDGSNTCMAFSGQYVSANCTARPNISADLTGRVGWAYGHSNHSLVYAKGGVALVRNRVDMTTNATPDFDIAPLATSRLHWQAGWVVGAGVEHMIAPAWSVKIEYDYTRLAQQSVNTPEGLFAPTAGSNNYFFGPGAVAAVHQDFQEVKLGLNYKIGADPRAQWDSSASAIPLKTGGSILPAGWEVEVGGRYWYSAGRFQKDLGSSTNPALANILNSRLTYNTTANSGEVFGRLDSAFGVFVKGFVGAGMLAGGNMNDEDWVLFNGTVPYSNTVSDPVKGKLNYATLDAGFNFFRGAGYKFGAFGGYNYYTENKSAYGCSQIANNLSDCVPPVASSVLGITENDVWTSVRAGLNGELMVTDRLKFGTDIAYLPYVKFKGTDDHVLRSLVSPESGTGRGWQLESVLSYLVTDQFSVGVGGRYWAMWTTKDAITNFGGAACPCQTQPAKAERYGVFVQASYKFAN